MKLCRRKWLQGIAVLGILNGAILLFALFAPVTAMSAAQSVQSKKVEEKSAELQEQPVLSLSSSATVAAVRIVTEQGKVLDEHPKGISVETGKPLNRAQVAESLHTLYRTGDYSTLRAVAAPMEGGIRLDFVVQETLFFNALRIEGLVPPPSEASAVAAMQIPLGQPYRLAVVNEALERFKDTLQEEGFYTAQVSADSQPHPETHQMDILVHVQPGLRARVGTVHLNNGTEFPDKEILSRLKLNPGYEITTARIQTGTERIHKFLVKKRHLSARTIVHRGPYDVAKNTIPLDVDVTEGPQVRVVVNGAKVSNAELKKLIPIYQEGAVDEDLLEEGKRNLLERLERQGYFDAEVDYTTNTRDVQQNEVQQDQEIQQNKKVQQSKKGGLTSEEIITYTVERGERHRLIGIEITGNHYFGSELLRSRLQISGGAFGMRARFSRRLVDSDARSMTNLYHANGFLEANVQPQVQDNYGGKEGDLLVRFIVQEGPQTRVASISIEGIHASTEEELLNVIGETPGQPYSDFGVASDRDNILALYFNQGFPEASFTSTSEPINEESMAFLSKAKADNAIKATESDSSKVQGSAAKKQPQYEILQTPPVRLVYHIQEGPQIRVRNIFISGYINTRPGVIRREISVKPGEPLRQGDVVESQRRLYNLGIFNRVTIEPQNPNGTDPDKNVVALVEEAKRYTIAYGGGFEVQRLASTTNPTGGELQAAPRGILEVSKLNLTGRADSLSLKLRGSTIEDRALLGYSDPNTFADPHLSFQATAYTERTQDINTFSETQYEGAVQLTDQLTTRTSLVYRYAFRKVLVSNLNSHIAPQEIPLFQQPTLVSQFTFTWARDARNNPADATKGSFNSVEIGDADTNIGSSASFLRFFFQNSTYHPIKPGFGFARSTRFGILWPYNDTVSLTFPAPSTPPLPREIPLPERFFAGGGTSLRGFALNQAGPRDSITGFPVGGQALLVTNQEFRFPMRLPYLGSQLGGAVFYDGGNVYSRLSRISFRSSLPQPTFTSSPNPADPTGTPLTLCATNCSNELNYFSHTVGLGLRYATPVGPIRIDLGYAINRPFFVIPCTTGVTNCQKGAQLPKFQIFFNLGSTF